MMEENKTCEQTECGCCKGQGECPNEVCQCEGDVSFLDPARLKEQEDKIASGETVCNTESPEECESCSG
jgi:hypothetical protein